MAITSLSTTGYYNNNGAFNAGFQFTVGSSDIQVTQLGFYDLFNGGSHGFYTNPGGYGDGLINSVPVAIYNASGSTSLVSATITNSDAAVSDGGSQTVRLQDITPITLSANTIYRIAAITTNLGDKFLFSASGTFASGITYNGGVFGLGTANPTNFESSVPQQYIGPSFNFTVVPEQSAAAMGSAALLLLVRRRRY